MSVLRTVLGWFRVIRRPTTKGLESMDTGDQSVDETVIDLGATDTIDLHVFRPKEVPSVIEEFLDAAAEAGITEVRIIHGKGIGVQRRIVRQILSNDPRVSWFSDAPDASGWGATIARIDPPSDQADLEG